MKSSGFLSIEIAIASAIMALMIGGVAVALISTDDSLVRQTTRLAATTRAESFLTEVKIKPITVATTTLATMSDGWHVKTNTNMIDNDQIQADITVGFDGSQFKPETITGYLLDTEASASYSHCPSWPISRWQQAVVATTISVDKTSPINTVGTNIAVHNKMIYLTTDSPTASKPDFFVIDVVQPDQPQIISSLNTGPGLKTMHLVWPIAYAGNASIANQLQLLDVSNPNQPILQSAFRLPGSYTTNDVQITNVFYHKQNIYLGLQKSSLPELAVIDVSDKNAPKLLGQFEFNTTVHSIFVRGGLAYVGTASNTEMTILDINDPKHITAVGSFDAPGANGSGQTVIAFKNRSLLGRTVGNKELYFLDLTTANQPTTLDQAEINTTINHMLMSDSIANLATSDTAAEWQAWSTENDHLSLIKTLNLPAKATALACADNYIFTSLASSTALAIIKLP